MPWTHVVHEDGSRTLLDTVLFFEHVVRELPLDLLLGASVGSFTAYWAPFPAVRRGASSWVFPAMIGGLLSAVAVIGTLATVGLSGLLDELAQGHTRANAPTDFGAHWQYHLLSRMALIAAGFALVGILAGGRRADSPAPVERSRSPLIPWSLFALATLIYLPRIESLTDSRYLGHQARELFTHAFITLPLVVAVCARLASLDARAGLRPATWKPIIWHAAVAVALAAYLLAGVMITGAASHGQTDAIGPLVCTHFFEHAFGYVITPATAAATYLWLTARAKVSS